MMNVYSGYVKTGNVNLRVDFEVSNNASKEHIDSAFLLELGKLVELNYVCVGEYTALEGVCNDCKA